MRVQCRSGRVRSHVQRLAEALTEPAIAGEIASRSSASSTSTASAAEQLRDGVRPRRRRHRHRPRRDARGHQARPAVRRRRPGGAPRRGARPALAARLPRADRKADGGLAGARRASWSRLAERGRPHPRGGAEPPLHPGRAAHPPARSRAARSASSRRSMPTSSSARISAASAKRWTMCCCSTWRSTRSMRRASWPARMPLAVYCHRDQSARAPGTRMAPRPMPSSRFADDVVFTYRGSWAAEGAQHQLGKRVAHRRHAAARCSGTAPSASRRMSVNGDDGLPPRRSPSRRACRRPTTRRPTATPASSPISSTPSRPGSAPETAGNDNIKSLAMVFGAIESARTGSRVAIAA